MLVTLLLPTSGAFEVQTLPTGEEMHYGEMPVTYAWVVGDAPTLAGVEAAIDDSFAAWAAIDDAYVSVEEQTSTLSPAVALDDENLVFFNADWPEGNDALAITTTWTDAKGAIVQYDIHINATVAWSTTGEADAFDLQAAITHEVGHVLGLGHSTVEDATMYAKHEAADVHRRVLHADDEEAARYLYGEPPASSADTGDAPAEPKPGCDTTPGGTPLLGLLLLALARRGGAR